MIIHRRTVAREVTWEGPGLHSGVPTKVVLRPGEDGIWFRYGQGRWKACPAEVTDTTRSTKLGDISTIEHLMSALAGLEITDAEVEVSAPEMPAAGGSSAQYVEGLAAAGFVSLSVREARDLFARVFVQEGDAKVAIAAGHGHWAYRYDVGERWPGVQEAEYRKLPESYADQIAPARTFGLIEELPHLERLGLARGLDEHSALVLGAEGYENEPRFPDEPARHKLLDAIGDLYLAGVPIRCLDVVGERSGHRTNVQAAAKLKMAIDGTTI